VRNPEVQSPRTDAQPNNLLGPGSVVEGKLSFKGPLRIDGTFTGEITTDDVLIIGAGATVAADINCVSAVVSGELTGNIEASESVEMHGPARVKGDIATPTLSIGKGVIFDGLSKMGSGEAKVTALGQYDGARKPKAR
jgi:cytoskeletal protein CcmA (bactofilin family)